MIDFARPKLPLPDDPSFSCARRRSGSSSPNPLTPPSWTSWRRVSNAAGRSGVAGEVRCGMADPHGVALSLAGNAAVVNEKPCAEAVVEPLVAQRPTTGPGAGSPVRG